MRWFGPAPFARACEVCPRAETPAGVACHLCGATFDPSSRGFLLPYSGDRDDDPPELAYHQACLLASILGPVSTPERCPNHPPASTLDAVACSLCGAFKPKQ